MFFDLTDDQVALRDAVRQLCEARAGSAVVRAAETTAGVSPALWDALAAMGVFGLRLPEADGGAGLGWADAVVVFEELGRACVPGPLVATHLAAGLVAGAADGSRRIGTVAPVAGQPILVEHLDALDAVVVAEADGLRLVEAADLAGRPVERPLDPLTPLHLVDDLPAGTPLADAAGAAAWRRGGTVLTAALQVGLATTVLDQATAHAHDRVQFQRPIGTFQAVKHRLADCLVRVDVAQAAVHAAAVALGRADEDEVDRDRAVATAGLVAGEAALENAKAAVQLHGAMGFTWELDVHLALKRAWVLDTHHGGIDEHAAAVAALL